MQSRNGHSISNPNLYRTRMILNLKFSIFNLPPLTPPPAQIKIKVLAVRRPADTNILRTSAANEVVDV